MQQSPLRLIKRCIEYKPIEDILHFPRGIRGICILYNYDSRAKKYNVVYVVVK